MSSASGRPRTAAIVSFKRRCCRARSISIRSISSTADGPSSRHTASASSAARERVELRHEQPAVLRPRDQAQLRLGDDRQRALAADEQRNEGAGASGSREPVRLRPGSRSRSSSAARLYPLTFRRIFGVPAVDLVRVLAHRGVGGAVGVALARSQFQLALVLASATAGRTSSACRRRGRRRASGRGRRSGRRRSTARRRSCCRSCRRGWPGWRWPRPGRTCRPCGASVAVQVVEHDARLHADASGRSRRLADAR